MRQHRWRTGLGVAALAVVVAATGQPAATAAPTPAKPSVQLGATETGLVRLRLPDRAALDRLVASGADDSGVNHG